MDVTDLIVQHYKENYKEMALKAGRILKDYAYGEDAVQEVYLRCYEYKNSYDPERGTFDKWFNKIFWRTVSSYKSFVRGIGDIAPIEIQEVSERFAENAIKMSTLSPKYKEILYAMYVKGYKPKEIVKVIPCTTVHMCYKANKLFKKEVVDKCST